MRPVYALALLLCAGCGCGEDSGVGVPFEACGPEAEDVTEQDFWIERAEWADETVGLDLDGEETRCEAYCINDEEGGIDNRFGAFLDGISDSLGEDAVHPIFNATNAISHGNLTWLLRTRSCSLSGENSGLEELFFNGVDLDGDPTDNADGTEEFRVTRSSVQPGGDDPVQHAIYRFDGGGELVGDEYRMRPAEVVVFEWMVDGEMMRLPIREIHLHFRGIPEGISGILAGSALIEDLAPLVEPIALAVDVDPDTAMNIVVNQADMDLVPEGPTDDACSTADDCPVPWRACGVDGYCIEPADRMDAISATLVFEAVPCTITGIAEE